MFAEGAAHGIDALSACGRQKQHMHADRAGLAITALLYAFSWCHEIGNVVELEFALRGARVLVIPAWDIYE